GRGNAVRLAGDEEPVDEFGVGHRSEQCRHNQGAVEVGSDDVRLFREVGGTPYQVVAARLDARYGHPAGSFLIADAVAYGHGIGRAAVVQAQSAPQPRLQPPAVFGEDDIPAAGTLRYDARSC